MGVARQAPTLAAAGLVEELKAEGEEKGEDELDKRLRRLAKINYPFMSLAGWYNSIRRGTCLA